MELAQETLFRAYQNQHRAAYGPTTHWLLGIALNVWRNFCRDRHAGKRGLKYTISIDDLTVEESTESRSKARDHALMAYGEDPLETLIAKELHEALAQAVESLPPNMRICLQLRIEGRKYSEIADILNVSIQTVRSQLFHAKTRLIEKLKMS